MKRFEVDPIIARLQAMPEVRGVEFVSEEAALVLWRERLRSRARKT